MVSAVGAKKNERWKWLAYERGKREILDDSAVQTFQEYERKLQALVRKLKI